MKKKFLILLIFFLSSNNLYAEDLINTLSDAFKNNSKLNAERASLNASKQDVNISRGEFLPSVTLSGDMLHKKIQIEKINLVEQARYRFYTRNKISFKLNKKFLMVLVIIIILKKSKLRIRICKI